MHAVNNFNTEFKDLIVSETVEQMGPNGQTFWSNGN